MISYLLLVPYALVLGIHALVAFALPQEVAERRITISAIAGPLACYVFGSLGALVAVGPLWYGKIVGEFHLSHHLIRGALVAISLVFFLTYVHSHR